MLELDISEFGYTGGKMGELSDGWSWAKKGRTVPAWEEVKQHPLYMDSSKESYELDCHIEEIHSKKKQGKSI